MDCDTHKLRTLSLFSGIGGIDIGLKRWCETVCYVELDSYGQAVLCKNMAAGYLDIAPIWDDITTFGADELAAIGPIDAITAGFPCTDISCAGKGAGITGEQSGLFFEIIRLIRLARPRIIFLENVPAVLGRGMGEVLRELAESGDYDIKWRLLSAAEVGAPHKRDRWWCLAYTESGAMRDDSQNERQANRKINSFDNASIFSGADVADSKCSRQLQPQGGITEQRRRVGDICATNRGQGWAPEPGVVRMVHGVPDRSHRLRCLGNAVVPQVAQFIGEMIVAVEARAPQKERV